MPETWLPPDDESKRLVQFQALVKKYAAEPGAICGICYSDFEPGEGVTLLLCGHILHRSCVIDADYYNQIVVRRDERTNCPYCRAPLFTQWNLTIPRPRPPPAALASPSPGASPSASPGASPPSSPGASPSSS